MMILILSMRVKLTIKSQVMELTYQMFLHILL